MQYNKEAQFLKKKFKIETKKAPKQNTHTYSKQIKLKTLPKPQTSPAH